MTAYSAFTRDNFPAASSRACKSAMGSQLADSELDLIVSGTRDAIMMVEAGAKLLPEDVMAEAILFGHRALQPLIDIQEQLREAVSERSVGGGVEVTLTKDQQIYLNGKPLALASLASSMDSVKELDKRVTALAATPSRLSVNP